MDNTAPFSLADLMSDPRFDFLRQFLSNDCEQNQNSNINLFNEATDNPYDDLSIKCNYFDEAQYICEHRNLKKFSLLSLNTQSLPAKYNELCEFIYSLHNANCSPDVILLQETWKIVDNSIFPLRGYSELTCKNRTTGQGGGVGLYFKNGLKYKIIEDKSLFFDHVLESICAEITLPSLKKIAVVSLYRPAAGHPTLSPVFQFDQFLELFSNLISSLLDSYSEVYLLGDFNINVLKYTSCEQAKEFIDLLFSFGLLQVVTKPTRCTPNSATLIDHVLSTPRSSFFETAIITNKISDHFPIIHFLDSAKNRTTHKAIVSRDFSAANCQRFKELLHGFSWNSVRECTDAQEAFSLFNNTFLGLYESHFPIVSTKFNRNLHCIEKWFSKGLLTSRVNKLKLSKTCITHPTQENISKFKQYRHIYNKTVRAAKKLFFDKQLKCAQSNLKKTWNILKEALNKTPKQSKPLSCLLVNGKECNDPRAMAEALNDFFTNAASLIVDQIPPTDRPPPNTLNEPEVIHPLFSLTNSPVTRSEIAEIFKLLQDKKTQDYCGISINFIKNFSDQLVMPLQHIINLSFETSVVPNQMKIAKVIPLFKSGDPLSMDNYRPISLLSSFSKILEKIVANRLCNYLETNNLLSTSQFGFRPGHSTVHPMTLFANHVSKALNEKEHTIAVFCDLRKAFDSCNHQILLSKLSRLGIRGAALNWFANYLSDRSQFVCVNGVNSSMQTIRLGVPQGSILGPILFLLYINDLPLCTTLLALLFADDTTLLASGSNLPELINYVNDELYKISTYFRNNKLALHPQKTQFMLISNSPTAKNASVNLFINNNNSLESPDQNLVHPISRVLSSSATPAVKFLGVYFDTELNFKYQIHHICSKISRALFMLRRCKNLLSSHSLKTLYYSLVHCHLIYGIQIWGCSSATSINTLFKKQKSAIRIVCQEKHFAHTEPLFKSLLILPLPSLVEFFKLQFMQQYVRGLLPVSFNNLWITNEAHRAQATPMVLRNDAEFFIPSSRLAQCSLLPYYSFPRSWRDFDQLNPAISILRNKNEFNTELKTYFIKKLSSALVCNRLFCPSCSSTKTIN